jgi:transcriptional regulator with XRE-family HTH domain
LDERLAARVAELRAQRGWSLDDLADRAGISRSTLSRLERGQISPTTAVLGKLCIAYGWTMSRLLADVETEPAGVIRAADQPVWRDPKAGFSRRIVSAPHAGLRAEVVEVVLDEGADIAYEGPAVHGLEQHVWLLDGNLRLDDDHRAHDLHAGDCLRFRLWGPTRFRNPGPGPVRYVLVMVMP